MTSEPVRRSRALHKIQQGLWCFAFDAVCVDNSRFQEILSMLYGCWYLWMMVLRDVDEWVLDWHSQWRLRVRDAFESMELNSWMTCLGEQETKQRYDDERKQKPFHNRNRHCAARMFPGRRCREHDEKLAAKNHEQGTMRGG